MLPKEIRDKKTFAKKCARETKRVLKGMDDYLNSSDYRAIEMAEAFYTILSWHITQGDLQPENVNLASLLRRNKNE